MNRVQMEIAVMQHQLQVEAEEMATQAWRDYYAEQSVPCVRCGLVPASNCGLCSTCDNEYAERFGEEPVLQGQKLKDAVIELFDGEKL